MNERGLRVQSGMERWLDTERHLARFPRREHGEAKVIEYGVTALQTEMEMRRYMTHVVWTPPGRYLKLVVGEELWMSNTRMEYLTNFPFIEHAMGEILIAGLGLGLVLDQLIGKEWVGHIDVVEKHPDVYELVGAAWVDHPKVNLHLGDIYTWRPPKGKQYDSMFFDIWDTMNYPRAESTRLHNMFRPYRVPEGTYLSWGGELPRPKR